MHCLYILYSKTVDKYYVGESHNVEERILKHNEHAYKGSFSKIANDWELCLKLALDTSSDAIYLEKFIKRMKSKVFIEKIISNPDILLDILLKKKK
ncbi:GIY-YIG nuclease family protein [Flavobacterium sp. j3]|uniref:GIY-YIG nuclease family protein n=1 Tax=Flavobacterium aureirubrum TaxID=3133147 RepID=A0ABU9NAY4_9FLAO